MPRGGQAAQVVGPARLERRATTRIEAELEAARCVGLFGARQVGKSTIANAIALARGEGAIRLNMRRPADRAALADDEAFFAEHADKLVVIDEAPHYPDAFDIVQLRLEQELHQRAGGTQFLLLGSSSVELDELAAERLGARLSRVDVDPIYLFELADRRTDGPSSMNAEFGAAAAEEALEPADNVNETDRLWLRGGLPFSLLAADDAASYARRRSYVTACLRRPLVGQLAQLEHGAVRRTLDTIAASQGGIFAVDKGTQEFRACVRHLETLGLVRALPLWAVNRNTQLNRAPKVFIRDSGLLHALRACPTLDAVYGTAGLMGDSWEGFCIENLIGAAGDRAQASYYRRDNKDEIDLVLEFSATRRWVIEVKHGRDPAPSAGFHRACEAVEPERRMFIHRGEGIVSIAENVDAYPLQAAVDAVLKA